MAYHSACGITVLFGGEVAGDIRVADTWQWDGSRWREVLPGPGEPRPSPRTGHAMAYDARRGVVVLFGGYLGQNGYSNETWEWDCRTGWTQRNPPLPIPSPRAFHKMAYDSLNQVMVLFGGGNASGQFNDTWMWDGSAWVPRSPPPPIPTERYKHAMDYDSARRVTILFGGWDDAIRTNETWEWDGTAWRLSSVAGPRRRYGHAMVYDSGRSEMVLFGGNTSLGYMADTWRLRWCGHCPGDVNGDARVNQEDLGIILAAWGCIGEGCPGDLNGDGRVDQQDLGILLANWNRECP